MKTRRIALLLVILLMLALIVPVYAQAATAMPSAPAAPTAATVAPPETHPVAGAADQGSTEETTTANGVTTLVLLVGLGAVALVGFGSLLRANYKAPQE